MLHRVVEAFFSLGKLEALILALDRFLVIFEIINLLFAASALGILVGVVTSGGDVRAWRKVRLEAVEHAALLVRHGPLHAQSFLHLLLLDSRSIKVLVNRFQLKPKIKSIFDQLSLLVGDAVVHETNALLFVRNVVHIGLEVVLFELDVVKIGRDCRFFI